MHQNYFNEPEKISKLCLKGNWKFIRNNNLSTMECVIKSEFAFFDMRNAFDLC